MNTFYINNITKEAKTLLDCVYSDDENRQYVVDTFEALQCSAENKALAVAYAVKDLKSKIELCKNEKKFIADKQKYLEEQVAKLSEATIEMMKTLEVDKVDNGVCKISVVKNGGVQPLEIDEANVPVEYTKLVYEIDKDKIRRDLEKGKDLPFARLTERSERLNIK